VSNVERSMEPGGMMNTMVFDAPGKPLRWLRMAIPIPGDGEVLIKVGACGVCRTDLHIVDGDLPLHRTPLILGHEVVGRIARVGPNATAFQPGERVGVPWLGGTCGHCDFCHAERENLCDTPVFTGYDRDGGYAEYAVADARYVFRIPDRYDDVHAAPLLCAGLIGYRSYAMLGDAKRIGLYGFGAAAHIIAQVAIHQNRQVYAFTRPGDTKTQDFARRLGAVWAGDSNSSPPIALDGAIIFAPAGTLVPKGLADVRKGGIVVCAGIHMSDIPSFPYSLLWGERVLRSVANLTRADGDAFMRIAQQVEIKISPVQFDLRDANQALTALRDGAFDGAAVLSI